MGTTISGITNFTSGEAKSTSAAGFQKSGQAIMNAKTEVDKFAGKTDLTEVEMIEYNLAASKYSTMVSLASGLVKNLSDTEKQVANKM